MYTIQAEFSFDAAHYLAGYKGACGNLHGHRWRVLVEVGGEELKEDTQERGMLLDFSNLKRYLKAQENVFDHKLIIEDNAPDFLLETCQKMGWKTIELPFRPTAENLAMLFYGNIKQMGFNVVKVSVYETPNNLATYQEDK